MSRIFLARHGETVWHGENRYAGSSNVALTERGLQQAEQLGGWAATAALSHLYVSPMQRALDTVAPAARVTGLPPIVDARLREIDFGHGEGLTDAEMQSRFPAKRAAFLLDPAANFLPGGEDPVDAVKRGTAALDDMAAACGPSARVLVVAHNTLIRLLLCHLLEVPLSRYRSLFPSLRNAALTEIDLCGGAFSLRAFNTPLQNNPLRSS